METERETRARTTTSTGEDFPYRDLFFVNLSIPSTCSVNPDSVCGDCLYRSFLFFSFFSTISRDSIIYFGKRSIFLSEGTSACTRLSFSVPKTAADLEPIVTDVQYVNAAQSILCG